ncbi:hypothetical protein B0H21DRAFT_827182 [Amylocystis lapponica]|nr:hypothetical protein B0H21DRAFT_827182 [Amylocystis lapponica]
MHRVLRQHRLASTAAHPPYPFPTQAHPSPHQIFHLPPGASHQDVKARYYDLVRVHHPDSPLCRDLAPAERHARFQAITAAYDALRARGRHDPVRAELERRRRAMHRRAAAFTHTPYAHRPTQQEWTASADERWKDWLLITAGLLSLGAGLAPALLWPFMGVADQMHLNAAANLAHARREGREQGPRRREEIRRVVQQNKQKPTEEDDMSKLDGS